MVIQLEFVNIQLYNIGQKKSYSTCLNRVQMTESFQAEIRKPVSDILKGQHISSNFEQYEELANTIVIFAG